MATEITKPNDTKPSHEAPKETLNSIVPPTAKPDRANDPNFESSSAPPSLTFDSATSEPKKYGEESRTNEAVVGSAPANSSAPASDIEKKICRAELFGISAQLTEEEKRNSRVERFRTGSAVYGSESGKGAEELKRKARSERFGLTSSSLPSDEQAKKKARLARFAPASNTNPLEEAKRNARAARFASTLTSSISEVNGKGNIEPEATIIGKAAGGT